MSKFDYIKTIEEFVTAIEAEVKTESINFSISKDIGDYSDVKELRDRAKNFADLHLQGKSIFNKHTKTSIEITKKGLKKTFSHSAEVEQLLSIFKLKDLLEKARWLFSRPPNKNAQNIKEVHTFGARLNIDKESYWVRMIVKEYYDGRRFYNHDLTEVDKQEATVKSGPLQTGEGEPSPQLPVSDSNLPKNQREINSNDPFDESANEILVEYIKQNELDSLYFIIPEIVGSEATSEFSRELRIHIGKRPFKRAIKPNQTLSLRLFVSNLQSHYSDQYGWRAQSMLSYQDSVDKIINKKKSKVEEIGESLTLRTKKKREKAVKGEVTVKQKSGHRLQGRIQRYGLDIAIENKKGSVRRGVDPNGKKWAIEMKYPYGYIRGTLGKDGDAVDTFVGPFRKAKKVYVVHQKDIEQTEKWQNGRDSKGRLAKDSPEAYDEDKVMLCFRSKDSAISAYKAHYDRPDLFLGPVSTYTVDEFKIILERSFGKKIPTQIGESLEWIGVDLDGTWAEWHGWKNGDIGRPIPEMTSSVLKALNDGFNVKIFTARASIEEQITKIQEWLANNDLPVLEITNKKDNWMIEHWDDLAVKVEKNTGRFLIPSDVLSGKIGEQVDWINEILLSGCHRSKPLTLESILKLENKKHSLILASANVH